ncbi:PAS domain S-box protein [Marinobacter litoralis]|uniref:PAS domain S-box protein n=1 Tax=Marinobacter litoralis TaxID=187981 RepID=UPI0018ECDDC1|nr:PAS domain S-box protein [Marinobacter litoralis]MBJ6138928.1 PAS domain S-box protein [Marinobacter litoralis]
MSFRWKTILGIAAIEIIFLTFLVWQAGSYIHALGNADIEKRAEDTVSLAGSVLLDSLIDYDLATIDEQVQQIAALDGVDYVELNGHGKTLASSSIESAGVSAPDVRIDQVTDGVYDVVHPLEVAGQELGTLKIGFSVKELYALAAQAQTRLYAIAGLELLLVAICSWLLAGYLTKRILLLRDASDGLHAGKSIQPIPSHGGDEIAETILAFNRMTTALTEREFALKIANDKLSESNTKLIEQERETLSLLSAAPDSIAVLHPNGSVVFANEELFRLINVDKKSLMGRRLTDFLRVSDDATVQRVLSGSKSNLRSYKCRVLNSKDQEISAEINASRFGSRDGIRTILIIRDKTHEQELESQADLQERLKSNLVDSSLDAVVTITGDGKVIDFSPSAEALFGWRKQEIMGLHMADFLIPEDLKGAHEKGMRHYLATGEGPLIGRRVETQACRKSGKIFPVELALTAIRVDCDVYVTATIRDISERKQREEELITAKAEAEEASKAKSRFLSYMSHEIRSPMNAVLGSLALIQERGQLGESDQYYLGLAKESGNSLLSVINEVLDFSKIEAGHIQFPKSACSLSDLIKGVQYSILAKGTKPEVGIIYEVADSVPPMISVDKEHLSQVLTILLDNAYKFTDVGEIVITAECGPGSEEGDFGRLRIRVRDTGPGIPSECAETIFSEFEQTDAIRDSGFGGTGLGLAIAKRLVLGMSGFITVESEVGAGSTFSVEIPFDLPQSEQEPTSGSGVESNASIELDGDNGFLDPPLKPRILLVDDVDANLVIGSELLKNRGYLVDKASNGREAVERAEETVYAVILMDMRMPILNGLEATLAIRSSSGRNANTPIIALTANAEKSEIERCLEGGMNGFVSKPFDIDRLQRTIEHCLVEAKEEKPEMKIEDDSNDQELEVLSRAVLGQLIKDTSAESLPMMISVFINEIKKRTEGINEAVKNKDDMEVREQAHALKSCAGTFGGLKLQAIAQNLEDLASQSSATLDTDAVARLQRVAEQTLVAYSEYRESLPSSSITSDPSV